jgi:A-macroglobulin receptor
VETTGLAVQALLKWGRASGTTRKGLAYITAKKDSTGAWGSTQATIMALRALLFASEKGTADLRGTVEIAVNGKTSWKLVLTPENNDLLHQFVFKGINGSGSNLVEIRYEGKGTLGYQAAGQYFIPWDKESGKEPFSISVNYDRTKLAQDDIVTATATMRNNLPKTANMVMVDLGIPPGFDLLSEDLQEHQKTSSSLKSGRLEKFSQTATQAILYFNAFAAEQTVQVKFRLRAKYPIRTRTFQSRVYTPVSSLLHQTCSSFSVRASSSICIACRVNSGPFRNPPRNLPALPECRDRTSPKDSFACTGWLFGARGPDTRYFPVTMQCTP